MRPTLRRLLVGAAAAAAAASVAAAPAQAAAAPSVSVVVPDATVAAGYDTVIDPILFASEDSQIDNPTMVFQLSGDLSGVSLAPSEDGIVDCTANGAQKVTCTPEYPIDVYQDGDLGWFEAKLAATKAALGEKGKLKITLSGDNISTVSTTVDVEVAEAVDLAAGRDSTISVKPGGAFDAGLEVRNTSGSVAHGTAVIFDTDYAFRPAKQFSNCYYDEGFLNACVFDQDLAAGRTYDLTIPYTAGADTQAPGGAYGEFEWLTSDDFSDLLNALSKNGLGGPGKLGSGGKLELTELPSVKSLAKTKQTDPNYDNNFQNIDLKVNGNNGVDLAAKGATFKGSQGQTVAVTVGVENVGPATLDWSRSGEAAAAVVVTPPTGTTVAKLPEGCFVNDLQTDKSATKSYLCLSTPLFPVKTSVTWTFEFKVNKATDNARGSVEVNPKCECDIFAKDINKANNTAALVLNPTGAGGAGGSTGGQGGGGLPITGPQTAIYGGAGAVLVAAGVIGFLVARRRRTRFEA
jgi:hypothetical protein